MLSAEETKRFNKAKAKIIGNERIRNGIGMLGEKTLHAVLKNFYEPNEDFQEISIDRYVADICRDKTIIEIQTRQMYRMKWKLAVFLPDFVVKIVYPIPKEKTLFYIDPESGEISPPRKSPKKGNPYMIFKELYGIKQFLSDKNIRFDIVLLDIEEYKLLNGYSEDKKKGSEKYDRIPVSIREIIQIERREDFLMFLPPSLPKEFTVSDLKKEAHIHKEDASYAMNILTGLNITKEIGRKGHQKLYTVADSF